LIQATTNEDEELHFQISDFQMGFEKNENKLQISESIEIYF
jgi:hypothetical protein